MLYFSILKFDGDPSITGQVLNTTQPSVMLTEHGWQLKGSKHKKNEMLVCVFSFTSEKDNQWAEHLFADIVFIGAK